MAPASHIELAAGTDAGTLCRGTRRLSPMDAGDAAHGSSPSGLGAGPHGGDPDTLAGRRALARVIGVRGARGAGGSPRGSRSSPVGA